MSLHPDADALVRAILDRPSDDTPRLVLADWLDDTGRPGDAAWAAYIRARCSAARQPGLRPAESGVPPQSVRAVLTIPAATFVRSPCRLLDLLPAPNIRVRLGDACVPRPVFEMMPESVARENHMMALADAGGVLFVAMTEPENEDVLDRLTFIIAREVVAVGAEQDDVLAAINRHYGEAETAVVECVSYESPLVGLDGDAESGALYRLFHTSFSGRMTGFEMEAVDGGCRVRHLRAGTTHQEEWFAGPVYDRLRGHVDSLPTERVRRDTHLEIRDVQIPLLSGRPFPVSVEYERGRPPRRWFRIRYRW
jgi:uncharacterized protein (TIGR02996 family)